MTDIAQPTAAGKPELVAFADCELIPINSSMMLVINRANGNQQVVAPQVIDGLTTCTNFATVETHAAHLASTRAELNGKEDMAADALNNLKSAGMLLDADDICARLAQPAPKQLAPTRVFVITCDRPAAVGRLLDSILRSGQLSQHNALFLIDDSRNPDNRAANREAVVQFNLRSPRDMFYIGEEAQADLLSGLIEKLPEHAEGIRFLLDRALWEGKKTFGRSRTLSLLFSVGYRALVMDDDILCQAVLPPITQQGIGIGSGGMRQATFYENPEALLSSGAAAGFDPLSGHASLLGSTLSTALHTLNKGPLQGPQLQQVNAGLANVLEADAPVLVTQCGSLGDPGTGTHWVQQLGAASVQRLINAPHGLKNALENRLSWLGSGRPNVFKMPFMSQLTGLDNSQLLPPYFPAYRGEDTLFGAMLVAMHHDSVALEYPWSVPHLPLETRPTSIDEPVAGSGGAISLLARYLTRNIDYRDGTSAAHNMQTIARDALRMAARSDEDLALDYRSELARGQAEKVHIMMAKYEEAQKMPSPEWQGYIKRGLEEVQQALVTPQQPTGIQGIPEGLTEAALLQEFRDLATGFAAALNGWVEMREVASTLADDMIAARTIYPL
tara:strand:- start:59816 stop:61657 length:1842 start_codon:yes stop_codon:yes gene_type:complete